MVSKMAQLVNVRPFSLVAAIAAFLIAQAHAQYFVNPRAVYVESFEGWGTSLAWWPDVLGHMSDEVIEKVTTSFFSVSKKEFIQVFIEIGRSPSLFTARRFEYEHREVHNWRDNTRCLELWFLP